MRLNTTYRWEKGYKDTCKSAKIIPISPCCHRSRFFFWLSKRTFERSPTERWK